MAQRLGPVLMMQVTQFAGEVRGNIPADPASLARTLVHGWERALIEAKGEWPLAFAVQAYGLTKAWLGSKSWLMALAKADVVVSDHFFGADELVANHLRPHVASWIASTSKHESQTSAGMLEDLFRQAMGQLQAQDSLTPAGLADLIVEQGASLSEVRAEMLSRVLTNWSYNEGAQRLYRDEGIMRKEWLTTDDDATCDLCAPMNGTVVAVDGAFVGAGQEFQGDNDASMLSEWDIEHPPLHPNCRCALLPVVDMED